MGKSLVSVGKKFTARSWAFVLGIVLLTIGKSSMAAAPVFVRHTIDTTVCGSVGASIDLREFLAFSDADGAASTETFTIQSGPSASPAPPSVGSLTLGGGSSYSMPGSMTATNLTTGAGIYSFPSGDYGTITFTIKVDDGTASDLVTVNVHMVITPVVGITTPYVQLHVGQSLTYTGATYSSALQVGSITTASWSVNPGAHISVGASSGVVNANSLGFDTLTYSVTNGTCPAGKYKHTIEVLTNIPPTVSSFTGASLTPGSTINLTSAGTFNSTPANNIVYFGGVRGTVISGDASNLSVKVPAGATFASITILDSISQLSASTKLPFVPRYDSTGFGQTQANLLRFYANPVSISVPFRAVATPGGPYSVEFADLDGDGKPEAIVCGTGTPNVVVYKNQSAGIGNVTNAYPSFDTFQVGAGPLSVKLADFDGDGKLDIVTSNVGTAGLSLLRNTSTLGSISFASRQEIVLPTDFLLPSELTISDFDGDGRPDIAVCVTGVGNPLYAQGFTAINNTQKQGHLAVLKNNFYRAPGTNIVAGAFTYSDGYTYDYDTSSSPISITSGDLNNDGRPDIALSIHDKRKVDVFLKTATGMGFNNPVANSTASGTTGFPLQVRIADLNNDNFPDLVVAVTDSDLLTNTYNVVSIFKNSSSGTFGGAVNVTLPSGAAGPVALAIGDITGDTRPDIVVSSATSNVITILQNLTTGTAAAISPASFATLNKPTSHFANVCPAIADIDGNGIHDIAVVTRADNKLILFRGYPLPDTTSAAGDSVLCNGGNGKVYSTHRPASATGTWTVSNDPTGHVTITGTSSSTVGGVVTDTVYIHGASAGTETLTYTVVSLGDTNRVIYPVRTLVTSDPGTITISTGGDSICVGADKTFVTTGSGGTWSSTSTSIATISSTSGLAHGVAPGTDIIKYSITGCPAVSQFTVRVIGAPTAGAIIGTDTVCALDTMHIATGTHGGNWTSRHGLVSITMSATHDSAFVSRLSSSTSGLDTLDYTVVTDCGNANSFHPIFVSPDVVGGTVSGTHSLCVGGTTSLTISSGASAGVWSSSDITIATVSSSGVVTAVSAGPGPGPGTATISYTATNHCGSISSTFVVSVNAVVGAAHITPPASSQLCVGSTVSLSATPTGGTWASRNTSVATVTGTGVVGGGAGTGTVSIVYTSTGSGGCGVTADSIQINVLPLPVAGTITGSMGGAYDSLCANHAPVTFTNTGGTPAGTWTALNPAVANVDGSGNVTITLPTGAADTTTIKYTTDAAYTCGTAQVGRVIKVKKLPNAGVLTGPGAALCFPGTPGHPSTAVINNSIPHTTGIWGSANVGADDAGAALSSATVTSTSASFVMSATTTAGGDPYHTAHVFFVDTNFCGRDSVSLLVAVNTVPNVGAISTTTGPAGLDSMCSSISTAGHTTMGQTGTPNTSASPAGSSYFTFAWTRSNATVLSFSTTTTANTTLNGLVAGRDTITYSVTNVCGTGATNREIRVLNPASAGFIVAPDILCAPDNTLYVYDTTANGDTVRIGTWDWLGDGLFISNLASTFGSTTVLPSTITNTIIFTPAANYCGALTATKDVTINNYPNAGTITGDTSVCVGATVTLDDPAFGDLWYSSDPATATVDPFGVVTGVATGFTQIHYVANSVGCGSDTADHNMEVRSQSPVGFIFGQDTSCINGTAQLFDTVGVAAGGRWTSSNPTIAAVDTATGLVTAGSVGGQTTIIYSTSNGCGPNDTSITFRVFDVPRLTSSTTPPQTCDSAHFTYPATADTAGTKFAWTRASVTGISPATANADTSYIDEYLDNSTNTSVLNAVYVYTMTAHGCTSNATVTVAVIPTPKLTSPLFDTICSGQTFVYADVESTGPTTTANWTRPSVTQINSGAVGNGVHAINDPLISSDHSNPVNVTYIYTLGFMGCPTHTESINVLVNPSAVSPSITTHSENALCEGTMYQNFGTNIAAPAGNTYTWSAKNAQVWATGSTREYCLVNFTEAGDAMVYLNASVAGFNCPTSDSFAVAVSTAQSHKPEVTYFNGDFVCLSNTEDTYQWGYDDRSTLDSALFTGETNQNFYVPVPDFTTKYYFVLTTHNGCSQKSYFIVPTGVQNVTANMGDMKVYPNPADNFVNVEINNTSGGKYTVEVVDLLGHKLNTSELINNKTTVNVNDLAAGMYMINCYREGVKFASAKFVKN